MAAGSVVDAQVLFCSEHAINVKSFEIGLLATGGGGFSSGRTLGLAVFCGGFPDHEESMIEFITHESVHSWVLPFPEIWNEPIATYMGNLVLEHGHETRPLLVVQGARNPRDWIFRREFEQATVMVDLERRQGKIQWME